MEKVYTASALIFYNEKILLVWNGNQNLWMQPTTKINTNLETPNEALIRQIYDSFGYEIKIINVNQFKVNDPNSKTIDNPLLIQEHLINNIKQFKLINFFYLSTLTNKNIDNFNFLDIQNIYWFRRDEIFKIPIKEDLRKIILNSFQVILNSKKVFSC